MTRPDLDAFGLLAQRLRKLVYFGDVEVSAAASGGHFTTTISDLSTGDIDLDLDRIGAEPVDYLSDVRMTFEQHGVEQNMFTGAVLSVELDGRTAHIKARAAPSMTELLMTGMVVENAAPADIVHATARSAGFPEDRLEIHGLDNLRAELFEVVVPVSDIFISSPQRVGAAWLIPRASGLRALAGFDLDESGGLKAEFEDADSYLVAIVDARLSYDAEERGLAEIDLALAWLATRGRYGLATLPGGRGLSFSRVHALTAPSRGSVVLIRGLLTRRRWIRRPSQLLAKEKWQVDQSAELFDPELPADASVSDRQALAALHRAITEVDSVSRAQSLWQAIEAYASGTKVDKLFSKTERKRLEALIPDELSEAQRLRLIDVYKNLNDAPLMPRFRWRLEEEAVPVSKGEMALLDRLRDVRNKVTHGEEPSSIPDREELEHAISIVSRMLVFSIARARETGRISA